jgi:hypothetical protein
MRNLMTTIVITIAAAVLSGCATSASSTWTCADGTCLPKQATVEYYKTASLHNMNVAQK